MKSGGASVILQQGNPSDGRSVVLEDDGRTGYAYLLEGSHIVADLWLYNVGPDPETVDVRDPTQLPFQNPRRFCAADSLPRLTHASTLLCRWSPTSVEVEVDGVLWARLDRGTRPGWSRGAAVAGPLA